MKVPSRPDRTAALKQILVFYDEPQVALLRTDRELDMIAIAVESEEASLSYPFFACTITTKTLSRYLDNEFDLNFMFRNPDYGLYAFDWRNMSDDFKVPVRRATNSEIMNDDFYPESGFFARSHNHPLPAQELAHTDTHRFAIDGSWQAKDFSRFYSQMSDLYALYLISSKMNGDDNFVFAKDAVQKYFWRGGGAYVNFFHDIADHMEGTHPLRVSRIEYASPGKIDLSGDGATLSDLEQLIHLVGTNHGRLADLYRQIDKTLGSEKLRTANPDATFSGPLIEEYVFTRTNELASGLGLNSEHVYLMCSSNKILFAKVVLALYRRANGLYLFHAQGRVQPQRRSEIS